MAWYAVIIFVSSICCTVQYLNTFFTYTVQKGSDIQITPVIIALSNTKMVTWTVKIMSLHSITSYSSWIEIPPYVRYNQANITFTVMNVTTTMHYDFDLDDGVNIRTATVHVIVYGK